jgi:hypothetical protein
LQQRTFGSAGTRALILFFRFTTFRLQNKFIIRNITDIGHIVDDVDDGEDRGKKAR